MEDLQQLNLEALKNKRTKEAGPENQEDIDKIVGAVKFHCDAICALVVSSGDDVGNKEVQEQIDVHSKAVLELGEQHHEIVEIVKLQCMLGGLGKLLGKDLIIAANPKTFLREDEL